MPSSRLWIVATPIGNPGDLSPRGREILAGADLILAEDTRRAEQLFRKSGITPKRLLSFFEHNEAERQKDALDALEGGRSVALITDAGTPLMADPGYRLVRACRAAGLPVSPVPGPSAPVAALSAAGLPPIPFSFLGFLPRGAGARRELFSSFAAVPGSIVFFERKNRLQESLALACEILGDREIAICRELTKEHEEFIIGRLGNAAALAGGLLGEITVIIAPAQTSGRIAETELEEILRDAMAAGLKPKDAARSVRKLARGWSGSELYDLAVELSKNPCERQCLKKEQI